MKLSYDFEKYDPPQMSEANLRQVFHSNCNIRRGIVLLAASNLLFICLALLALVIAPYSMILSFVCLGMLGIYLSGSGVLAVLFSKKIIQKVV